MRAAVFTRPGEPLRVDQVEDPRPGPNELVLKVTACGVCGSDLHFSEVHDGRGGMRPLPPGTVMGHEFAGEVAEVGSALRAESGWRVGQRACALPYIACGRCAACLTGRGHRCRDARYTGLGSVAGGYAEYVRVGAHETLPLPPGVDDHAGALVEPLAVGLHAVGVGGVRAGDRVLVVGAGPVGLALALWCRFLGARDVVVTDLVAARAERACDLGATDCIVAGREDVVGGFKKRAGSRPDVVFDAVGIPGSQQWAMDYAPADGRVVVVGVCMQPDQILPVKAITKELQVNYAYMYRKRDFQLVIDLLDRERVAPERMVTDVVGFDAFPAAFEALKTPTSQCKVVLEPQRDG